MLCYIFTWIGVPLLNTIILLVSGLAVTWAHKAIKGDLWFNAVIGLFMTIYLGYSFTYYQYLEYVYLEFKINDGIFGSIFYLATGFHGLHVLIGTIFLIVGFFRLLRFHFTPRIHVGLQCAIWYWHFVDVVWIFLYIFVYIWGLNFLLIGIIPLNFQLYYHLAQKVFIDFLFYDKKTFFQFEVDKMMLFQHYIEDMLYKNNGGVGDTRVPANALKEYKHILEKYAGIVPVFGVDFNVDDIYYKHRELNKKVFGSSSDKLTAADIQNVIFYDYMINKEGLAYFNSIKKDLTGIKK